MSNDRAVILLVLMMFVAGLGAQPRRPTGPADAARLNSLGAAYMNRQQFEHALRLFRQAAALDPKLAAARTNEAIALFNLQRFEVARMALERVVKAHADQAHAWYNLGLLYKSQGDPGKALRSFERAAQLVPDDPDVFYFIGLSQSQLDQQERAIASFRHALELNAFHASAEFGLARALQKTGQGEQAREHLARFQHLTQSKLGTPMGLAYGDQGPLSLAIETLGGARPPLATIPVTFTDVSQLAGLQFNTAETTSAASGERTGAGACFFDLDDDGMPDLLIADAGSVQGITLFHNMGKGKFQDITAKAGLDGKLHATACAAGDYDNDGHTDLALIVDGRILLFHNQGDGALKNVTDSAGIQAGKPAFSLTFIDYDHDGDIDLFAAGTGPGANLLWRNNGNGTFTDATDDVGLAGRIRSYGVTGTDFNNDRAVDMIFTGEKAELRLNPREGKWQANELWSKVPFPPVVAAASLDFDKDGWMDLVFTHSAAPGITLWRNLKGRSVEEVRLPIENWRRAWGVAALDYDNDGWLDLVAVGETLEGHAEIRLLRNIGSGRFQDVTRNAGLNSVKLAAPRAVVSADYDGDGDADLLITQAAGPTILLRNDGGNQNHFLRLAFAGLSDNKSALGAKVEVFAGGLWQKWEITGSGYLGQSSTGLLAGLGKQRSVDTVRILWPTGVLQDEPELAANNFRKINEIDRRGSSCPVLFVWDGTRYRFIADMIGSGVVGHWVGPGERNIPDSTEYIKVEGDHIRAKNGLLSMRFMEPLEEVVYLDQARLLAIDHPGDVEVYPNEYFASNPPFPEFKVIASRNAQTLAGAWDDQGKDVLDLLRIRDRRYVGGFDLLPYKGFTKSHTLTIKLPQPYRGGPLRLLLYGYIEYFMANSMYAAWQAGINPVAPFLEAQRADGTWVKVIDDMGFPAGLPRTTVADLTGKLPPGVRQLRITTNLQIYWDQILVDLTPQEAQTIGTSEVPLHAARLGFHGYPRMREGPLPGDLHFIYEDPSPTGPYTRPVGAYTRLGDVLDLLSQSDDRLVVFGSGDEVQMEFDPSRLPSLPQGWKRDYFFFADGYEKDMDFYAAEGDTVAPLPFHRMTTYPYVGESYPLDDAHINDLLDLDTRFFSGVSASSYRFNYPQKRRAAGSRNTAPGTQ